MESIGSVLTTEKVKLHGGQISESLTHCVRKGEPRARNAWRTETISQLSKCKRTDGNRKLKTRRSLKITGNLVHPLKKERSPKHKFIITDHNQFYSDF